MIQIDLGDEERQVFLEMLETALSDLRMEIADTDSLDFREMLKGRKEVIKKVIAALQAGGTAPQAGRDSSLGNSLR